MIKPEQIPDEVVKAALKAWKKDTETFHPNAGTIAAAINAWPGMVTVDPDSWVRCRRDGSTIILPLTQEKMNE